MRLVGWAFLVFALTLWVQAPAAFYLRPVSWPAGAQPQGISGTLWNGRMASLGVLDNVSWSIRPGAASVRAGLAQQDWQVTLTGWPWNWRAELQPLAHGRPVQAAWQLDGDWQGRLQVQGHGLQCRSAQGQLLGRDLGLLAPWVLPMGEGRVTLACVQATVQLAGVLERPQQHTISFKADIASRAAQVEGALEPNATLLAPLVQGQWLRAGEQRFSREFKW
ncbi:type II secretion system protein N [Pseudomonas sp. R5(2019)]|uniref:type II secretion system protein N n=1 Tax=Pseudomonas sp. R5(2019) TaxID=2697566 RepID=UPI001411C19C|nr:type II secretion system protein N [Pseudomonas sp. R5(2019)]NBA97998.1 hypothetical protein [Pseudomonas sp. R5(2019)]